MISSLLVAVVKSTFVLDVMESDGERSVLVSIWDVVDDSEPKELPIVNDNVVSEGEYDVIISF